MNTNTKAAHHITAGDTVTTATGRTFIVARVNQVGLYFELISATAVELRARFDTQLVAS